MTAPDPTAPGCLLCSEPVQPGEEAAPGRWLDLAGVERPVHAECALREVAGHVFGGCDCTMPDATYREQARAAAANARHAGT